MYRGSDGHCRLLYFRSGPGAAAEAGVGHIAPSGESWRCGRSSGRSSSSSSRQAGKLPPPHRTRAPLTAPPQTPRRRTLRRHIARGGSQLLSYRLVAPSSISSLSYEGATPFLGRDCTGTQITVEEEEEVWERIQPSTAAPGSGRNIVGGYESLREAPEARVRDRTLLRNQFS